MNTDASPVRHRLCLAGLVQGVGFRPHVARVATELGLSGWAGNGPDGVVIEVQGPLGVVAEFERRVVAEAPPLAYVETATAAPVAIQPDGGFCIAPSNSGSPGLASVPADTATCEACLREMRDPDNRRYRHPFITCTDCGPRWTIVTGLPYDRPRTTMAEFDLCPRCDDEYHDPVDRRYHAQPIACHECGPQLHRLAGTANTAPTTSTDEVLHATQVDLAAARIVALKGIGGFHLAVDATNNHAVARLRRKKGRPDKPFAVMVRDLGVAEQLAHVSPTEAELLTSPARPIVLLESRDSIVSPLVAPESPHIGIVLPYSPVHHLLFDSVPGRVTPAPDVLVMTSGNVAGEPIAHEDRDAVEKLTPLADSFCSHDRAIAVPCDDSVVRIIDGRESPIRRSRGYAPLPVRLPFEVPPLVALGGDLKNTCTVAAGTRALLSQHLGDMDSFAAQGALATAAAALGSLHAIDPQSVVVDCHPGYRTTEIARRGDLHMLQVGHHHAHLAALMVEHGCTRDDQIVGFLFDGSGWGDDGTLWGGEMLVGGYWAVERRAHIRPARLPGGEAAIRSPWRMAMSYLYRCGVDPAGLAPSHQVDDIEQSIVEHQIQTGLHSPWTTSMGRLFDAAASILDVRHTISHEAQAAMGLEALAASSTKLDAPMCFDIRGSGVIDPRPVIAALAAAVRRDDDVAAVALAFHEAVAGLIARLAVVARDTDSELGVVGLSGGVFQNSLLTQLARAQLTAAGFDVLVHRLVPANDGGLSLGQAAVAGYWLSADQLHDDGEF